MTGWTWREYKDPVVICPQCGASRGDGDRFCADCGAPLGRCPACGEPASQGPLYCPACRDASARSGSSVAAAGPIRPVAVRRMYLALFCDIIGFTPLSESRDPEAVRELLSRYFEAARTARPPRARRHTSASVKLIRRLIVSRDLGRHGLSSSP